MALVNRDKDVTEQKEYGTTIVTTSVAASAGSNFPVWIAPYPCVLKAVEIAANGISGSPNAAIDIYRFIVGTGATTVLSVGNTLAVKAMSLSGPQGFSLAAAGSTLASLATGDVVILNQLFSGGNVAIDKACVSVVVQPTQDIKSHWGSQS